MVIRERHLRYVTEDLLSVIFALHHISSAPRYTVVHAHLLPTAGEGAVQRQGTAISLKLQAFSWGAVQD